MSLPDDMAAVVTDPKGELLARCGAWLKKRGHPIYVVSPTGGYGHGWDPLRECECADDARNLALQVLTASAAIGGEPLGKWQQMSEALLAAYFVEAWDQSKGMPNAIEVLFSEKASGDSLKSDAARFDFGMYETMGGSPKTSGSVLSTIQGTLRPWTRDQVAGFLVHEPRLDMRKIRKEKDVVFLVTTSAEAEEMAAIQWAWWARLFKTLGSQAGQPGCALMMDEFANLGRLEGVDKALNLLRSAGCGIHAHIQNTPQLKTVYGPQEGELVRASFGTVCALSGIRDDAEDVSRWLGFRTEVRASHSTLDDNLRAQYAGQQKNAVDPDKLRQMKSDQVLIVSGNNKPVIAKLRWWDKAWRLRRRVPRQARKPELTASLVKQFLARFGTCIPPKQLKLESRATERPQTAGSEAGKGKTQGDQRENVLDDLLGGLVDE